MKKKAALIHFITVAATVIAATCIASCGGVAAGDHEGTASPGPSPAAPSADLSSLTVSSGTLNPSFSADETLYTVMVVNAVTSVPVSGTPADPAATVSAPVTIDSLVASVPQMATITVTPVSGTAKNYRVLVTRAPDYPAGTPIYVNRANADDGDGTETDPFRSLQNAVNIAPDGAEIRVAQGIYEENIVLNGNRSVTIQGGYQSARFDVRDPETYVTTIRGDGSAPVVSMQFTGGVYDPRIAVLVDGFTVTGGTHGLYFDSAGNGGKMDLAISNNVIEGNGATLSGEGLLDAWGGGILSGGSGMVASITGNVIRNNVSGKGAGICVHLETVTDERIYIADNLIEDNVAHADHGGGVYLSFLRGTFENNLVRRNRIGETAGYGWGGGMIVDGGMRDEYSDEYFVTLRGHVFAGNFAPTLGGAVFVDEGANVRMSRELYYGNRIDDGGHRGGAALYVDGPRATADARVELSYCTFADNTGVADSFGNAIYAEVADNGLPAIDALVEADHCIFWGNASADQEDLSDFYAERDGTGRRASIAVTNSAYQSGCAGSGDFHATGCSTVDPEFVDPASGNYDSSVYDDLGAFAG